MTLESHRVAFESNLEFPLDDFQRRALDAIDAGDSVLVAAPTGSGKTLIAEYAAACAISRGTKTFYTTPLKALSNQKYGDLVEAHGDVQVGLLTGDNSVRGDASVVVMTTEVLRNMIYAGSDVLNALEFVVLDEVHYLQDRFRGAVWEEVLIHLPSHVKIVALSATVSNAEEFAEWIQTVRGRTVAIIEERRPVKLTNLYAVGEKGNPDFHLLPVFMPDPADDLRPNPEAAKLDGQPSRDRAASRYPRGGGQSPSGRLFTPSRVEIIQRLADENMLPAITFIFSRAGCDAAVDQCLASGIRLTTREERKEHRRIAEARTSMLSESDLVALRYDAWRIAFEAGIAAHHAGMIPPLKEAAEEAFAAGLVKVVFATETLALGINMPARTVVIEKLSKFTGEHHEFLTPGEYTQLTGRAGRRGIDDRGFAVVAWSPFVPFEQVAGLASRRTYALTSSFRPTYNMTANLVSRCDALEARHLLGLSFAQYRANSDVVALEDQLEIMGSLLEKERELMLCDLGDFVDYRALVAGTERPGDSAKRSSVENALAQLRPGSVLRTKRCGGRCVVLRHEGGRSGTRILVLGADSTLTRLGPADFETAPQVVGDLDIPTPFAPKNPSFRRALAGRLRALKLEGEDANGDSAGSNQRGKKQKKTPPSQEFHPVSECPKLESHMRAASKADRLTKDYARLERRVQARSDNLGRMFDRVLRVLEERGYLDGWSLTASGESLMRINSETDILVADAINTGIFDGLRPQELASIASVFTYEHRGPEHRRPPAPRWPSGDLAKRWRAIERHWNSLRSDEEDAGLPEMRPPDPGLALIVKAWASGHDLSNVLDLTDDLTGGDFVRHMKQLVDLLRQISVVSENPLTKESARSAADLCFRGVVCASGVTAQ
ncbi:MAG: DEAD/DEAH box helicase [Actinomycetes bacterium]